MEPMLAATHHVFVDYENIKGVDPDIFRLETATFTLTDENNLHAEHYFTLYPGALKAGTHEVTVRIPASRSHASG